MATETVQTAVTKTEAIVAGDAAVQKVVEDVVAGDVNNAASDIKKIDIKNIGTEVLQVADDEVSTHTVTFTCCCLPWSLEISHTPK
jgi:hypothetical protein